LELASSTSAPGSNWKPRSKKPSPVSVLDKVVRRGGFVGRALPRRCSSELSGSHWISSETKVGKAEMGGLAAGGFCALRGARRRKGRA
jgi:hypothetical protein